MAKSSKTIVCFGAGPAFKGGMANYNTSLAKSLSEFEDVKIHIISWSQQYPSIVPREFKDKVSKSDHLEGYDISCDYTLNYNNPFSWTSTARHIASFNPDKVIIQWSIAIQGLPLGRMVKKLKRLCDCEVIFDMHFVVQKEKSTIDRIFTKKGIRRADTFIVHAKNTFEELKTLCPNKNFELTYDGKREHLRDTSTRSVLKLFHPIYDLYQPDPNFDKEAFKRQHGLKKNVFLYFGFIRKYKGLHDAIPAFHELTQQRDDVSFMICGELFWNTLDEGNWLTKLKKGVFSLAKKIFLASDDEDEKNYNPLTLVEELGLEDKTLVVSEFIPNEDVNKYFQTANAGILFYERATPSGIESLSYNFNLPILTTRVGHFPETIQDGKNGYMVEENTIEAMTAAMNRFLNDPIPAQNVAAFADKLSWRTYCEAILAD